MGRILRSVPHDPRLADRMRRALAKRRGIEERRMFGGFCWMLNGNMLCGVGVGRYMFRVGKELEAEALARPGVTRMEMAGRTMHGGFVWVRANEAEGKDLESWITFATRYVGALPPKKPASKARPRARAKGVRAS
jgi:hypothetical protein